MAGISSMRFLGWCGTAKIGIATATIKPMTTTTTTTTIVAVSIRGADFGDTVVAGIAVVIGGDFVCTVLEANAAVKHIGPNYPVTVPL